MSYRSTELRLRNVATNKLEDVGSNTFSAIQALPRFMVKWGEAEAPRYGVKRIINATANASNSCCIGTNSLCGEFCFAHAENDSGSGIREDVPRIYQYEFERLKKMGYGASIFLSTDTEPLPGNRSEQAEKVTEVTRQLLIKMLESPPESLILHTHTDVSSRQNILEVLKELKKRTNLLVGVGFETDQHEGSLPSNLPPPCTTINNRLKTIKTLAESGIRTQAAIAPLVGFRNFNDFANIFPEIGTYRIMVGDLRLDFEKGGTQKAASLIEKLGLPRPSQDQAREYFIDKLGYPPELVGTRDNFYVVTPEPECIPQQKRIAQAPSC